MIIVLLFSLQLKKCPQEFTKCVHENSPILSTKIHLLCPREVCHPIVLKKLKCECIKMFAPLCSSSVGLSVHHDFTSLQIFATHYSIVKYLSFCASPLLGHGGEQFLQVMKSIKRPSHFQFSKPVRFL